MIEIPNLLIEQKKAYYLNLQTLECLTALKLTCIHKAPVAV